MNEDKTVVPIHVAIIPDGNRRWAIKRGLEPWKGHEKTGSYRKIKEIVDEARKLGIKYLSAWGFSTENWKRSNFEREVLFRIFSKLIDDCEQDLHKEKIRFVHLGRKNRIPKTLSGKMEKLEKETKDYKTFCLILCFDYGGRDEIIRAVNKLLKQGKKKVNEEEFLKYLDSDGIPEPDLIIRTGGEMRLSGFMPFQSVYSELCFTDKYFPDFKPKDLRRVVEEFSERERKFGE